MPNNFAKADALRGALPGLAVDLARELGEGWRRSDDGQSAWSVHVTGPRGERVLLGVDSDKPEHVGMHAGLPPEISASGAYTSDLKTRSIWVRASRGVTVMAKEIQRRLMPSYLEVLERARQRVEEVRSRQERRDEAAARVAEALGVPVPSRGPHAGPNDDVRFSLPHMNYGSVEVRTGGHVRIEVSGDIDVLWDTLVAIGWAGVRA